MTNNNYYGGAYAYRGAGNAWPAYGYGVNPILATAVIAGTAAAASNAAAAPPPTTVAVFVDLPCDGTPVYANNTAYYQCGSNWFTRAYVSGTVGYVVSNPPPGR